MSRFARALGVLGAATFLLAAGGCGVKRSNVKPGVASNALRVVSAPVQYTEVGGELKYQTVLSQPGAAQWVLMAKPDGATIDEGGTVAWKASSAQGGAHTFTVQAQLGGETVQQTFTVTASQSVVQASAHVDPKDSNGATLVVEAPLSPVRGAALQIDPGALPPGNPVAVTISSMNHAPVSAASQIAGIPPKELKPVDFGPTGLAFKSPVKVHLPVSDLVLKKGPPIIQTYDYASGKWEKIKVLSVDAVNGFVVGEINHFSTYVVTPPETIFDLKLSLGAAGSACADALLVRAPLALGFGQMPAAFVNGYAGTAATAADVLAAMTAGDALQIFTRVSARGAAATGEEASWALFSATRLPTGKFKVNVTSERRSGAFLATPPELAADDPEFLLWMNGSRVDFAFGGLGSVTKGATAVAEASLYLVRGADADAPPPRSANALGTDEMSLTMLQPAAGIDDNCDGALDRWDLAPQAVAPPFLTGMPAGPVHVAVAAPALFKVSSPRADVTFTWKASHPSVAVTSAMAGTVATAIGSLPGHFQIDVVGAAGTAESRLRWELVVEPASVQMANTPPFVVIGASASVVRAGDVVVLNAYGKDAEQAALTYLWASRDAALSATTGGTVVFTATEPGDYPITCVASDGSATSAPAAVTISVLSATANRAPGVPSVAPIGAVLQHAPGAPVSLPLLASAVDPDGDEVTYDFAPDRFTPPTFTLTKNGASAIFSSKQDGFYLFYVTATDRHGAVSPWAPVKIQVMPTLPPSPVDVDGDGYPAGTDCDDNNPSVFPGAKEICGDGIDQNCDKRDQAVADCDRDGDRFTTNQGDCDDSNPAIGPGAFERCDGIDNNCNGKVDEGFGLGTDCSGGEGACRVAAKTVCNASFTGVVCGGTPGTPTPEVCDGIDNDCNGQVDDLVGVAGGDVNNCGGCNVRCQTPANSAAACVNGGCAWTCAAGTVDLDRDPGNGCECRITNAGAEICDGVDNDCNGSVDEGAGAIFYSGDAATLGVGVCSSGSKICDKGILVTVRAQQIPKPEGCDGLDNDCNGRVDDGFDLAADPRNCGACGIVCGANQMCQAGKCSGNPDGGAGGFGGQGGFGGGFDGGAGGFGGGGGFAGAPGNVAVCSGPTGSYCADLSYDPANCGSCGHLCPNNGGCYMGICQSGAGGTAGTTGFDGGTAPTCGANQPNVCPYPTGGMYCTNFMMDPTNCGGCGRNCASGSFCQNGVCSTSTGGGCPAAFTTCGASCTSLPDDPTNCGQCALRCAGVCEAATCQPAGTAGFGQPCKRNIECSAGAFCMDEGRFGWPAGYCSMLCDASRPCGSGQVCVSSGGAATQSALGSCRQGCTTDADCGGGGRSGFKCNGGACAPDCLTAPGSCRGGEMCDASGRCVPSTTSCMAPLGLCMNATGGMSCADLSKDPANCGSCNRMCPADNVCNAGLCQVSMSRSPGLAPCPGTGGAPVCTNVFYDPSNCGSCGTICPAGTTCQGGMCNAPPPPPTCSAPMQLCGDGTAKPYFCTDVLHDPGNCGACNVACPQSTYCNSGSCVPGGQTMTCPAPQKMCGVATAPYCADVAYDRSNCGACGVVCPADKVCQNYQCVPPPGADGGAPPQCATPMVSCPDANAGGGYRCTDLAYDSMNCGTCGYLCPAGSTCQGKQCLGPQGQDGGTPG